MDDDTCAMTITPVQSKPLYSRRCAPLHFLSTSAGGIPKIDKVASALKICQSSRSLSVSTPNPNRPHHKDGEGEKRGDGGRVGERIEDVKKQALVHDIARRLCFEETASRILAAKDVRRVVRASSTTREAFAIESIVRPLVSLLGEKTGEAKEAGLLAILNIAARNERNKITLLQFGVLSPIVDLLQCQSTRLRELATAGILTLSSPDSNKPTILASGAASLLVQVINSGTIQGQVDAVTAMYNLSTSQQGFDARICLHCVYSLLALLRDCKKLSKFAEKATTLLELLSNSQEGRAAIVGSKGSILTLVETVEDGSLLAAEYATSILLNICKSCRYKYRELILNEGPIPSLLLLTVHGTNRAQALAHTLLELLRDNSKQDRVSTEELQCMVYKIVSHVDGPEKALETAGNILKDVTARDLVIGIVEMK